MPQSPTPFSGIFVSYRRDDCSGHAGRLFDNLTKHFGEDQIFMDIDTIQPGEDFVEVIEKAVGSCEIVIAVMGQRWLSSGDGTSRRLDNPNDFVRLEIATALKRNIRVIPVLVQKATMPSPQDLPGDIAQLSRRHAVELSDSRWQYDVAKLIGVMERVLAKRAQVPTEGTGGKRRASILVAAVLGLLILGAIGLWVGLKTTRKNSTSNGDQSSGQQNLAPVNNSSSEPTPTATQSTIQPANATSGAASTTWANRNAGDKSISATPHRTVTPAAKRPQDNGAAERQKKALEALRKPESD
jgi:hypothetical protein